MKSAMNIFSGIFSTLWVCSRILALVGCTCGASRAGDMVACRMKPKLMCQAGAGAESGGTMPATMSAATATFCCKTTAVKAGDGALADSIIACVSVLFGWCKAVGDCNPRAEKPSPPPGWPHCHVRHGTWMRLKTSRAYWRRF